MANGEMKYSYLGKQWKCAISNYRSRSKYNAPQMHGRIKSKHAAGKYGDGDFIEKLKKTELQNYKNNEEHDRYQETLEAELNYERVFVMHRNGPAENDRWVKNTLRKTFMHTHTRKKMGNVKTHLNWHNELKTTII